ncbi:hypothetical protein PP713_14435 [Mycobacterium sp. CSUR Q5927]|nr:hypothetical protein [Mycobacterium sp. CSUR Q5927]
MSGKAESSLQCRRWCNFRGPPQHSVTAQHGATEAGRDGSWCRFSPGGRTPERRSDGAADLAGLNRDRLVYTAQSRIAEQLRVLGTEGAEGELRNRQVRELNALQDRVGELDSEVRRLRDEAEQARQRASAELRQLIAQRPLS